MTGRETVISESFGSFINKTFITPEFHSDLLCIDTKSITKSSGRNIYPSLLTNPQSVPLTRRWNGLHPIPNSSKPRSHLKIEVLHQSGYGPPLLKRLWLHSLCLSFIEYAFLPFSAFHWDMTRPHIELVKSFKWIRTARFVVFLRAKIFIWSFFCPFVWELWHLGSFNRYPRGRNQKRRSS